ncbi:phage tail protein [Arcanobacterium buesumense]|uniref:Tape measure protein n=1 Tax=Arcanobacterium buesumense TaxID=2722751 RepID=A0A6H2ELQ5_9ACTO|nr:tape measure protein [Arcanobacterium buesumense]QJC22004.1 tape measure protein [Arcanobacterium buesumense]
MSASMDLGTAWLNVVPSFKGIQKSIRSELNGVDSVITAHSSGWGRKISSTLGSAFTTAGKMAGAGLAAATTFVASYTREALSASDATDKFKSTLNFAGIDSNQIEALTKSAQKYADLTVYDLSDIQSITAQLASNGVAGFDKLAEAAGNLNAVAGGNKETFKSVGMVITQTAGAGKLTAENWRQLSDAIPGAAGPIKKALLDAGAYTGDFADAMSKGQISAEEFNAAISSLGMTEAAQEAATSTATFEGAWGNFEAAIVGGLKDVIDPLKGAFTGALSTAAEKAEVFFGKIASGVQSMKDAFSAGNLDLGFLTGLGPILGGLAGMLGPLLSGLPIIGGLFTGLTGPVGLIIGAFAQMLANSEALRTALGNAGSAIMNVFAGLAPTFTALADGLGTVLGKIGDGIAPIIERLIPLLNYIAPALETLIPIVETVFSTLASVIEGALSIIKGVIDVWTGLLTGDWQMVWDGLGSIVSGAWEIITSLISGAIGVIGGVLSAGWSTITTVASSTWSGITSLVSSAWSGITSTVSSGASAVGSFISSGWNNAVSLTSSAWSNITSAVSNGVSSVMSFVGSLPGKIIGFFSNAGSWLVSAGKSVIRGFVDGLKSAFGWVKDTLSSLTSWLPDWKGPAPLDRVILKPAGKLVIGGFVDGLESQYSKVRRSLGDFTNSLGADVNLRGGLSGPSRMAPVSRAGVSFHIGAINNPLREPSSTSLSKELAKVSAGVGSLV